MWRKAREGRWREVLSTVEKLMVLDHRDLTYDENCTILWGSDLRLTSRTNIENNVNVDTLLSFMEDKLSTEYSVMDSLKKVKKTLHKMDGEAAQEEVGDAEGKEA